MRNASAANSIWGSWFRAAMLLLGLWGLPAGTSAIAANSVVQMRQSGTDFFFRPTNLTVHLGDTVTWTNTEINAHDTTHHPQTGTRLWASPLLSSLTPGDSFSYVFAVPGVYPYFCRTHFYRGHPEETGTVTVVDLPPSIAVTSPSNGALFFGPASFTVTTAPSDSDGKVVQVEFFMGANSLGVSSNYPFSELITGLGAGSYALTAVAMDNFGAKSTSAVVNVTVVLATPSFPLAATTQGGGVVTPNPVFQGYPSNSLVTVTATPAAGWTFLGWTGDASGANPVVTLSMVRPSCVQAVFGTTLSTSVEGSGSISVSPASALYPYQAAVLLTAQPQPGNYFVHWTNSIQGSANPRLFMIGSTAPAVTARFAPLPAGQFSLVVLPQGFGRVTVSPGGNLYGSGQSVVLTALPDAGQSFTGWSGDAVGAQNPLSVVMDQSRTIQSNFSKRPRLAINACPGWTPREAVPLLLSGEFGGRYEVDASTDLVFWTPLVRVTNYYGTVQLSDPAPPSGFPRFYRVLGP